MAGSIEELKVLSEKLETKDGGPKAKRFAQKIMSAMPRFEAGEEVRAVVSSELYQPADFMNRNADVVNIDRCRRSASNGPSLAFPCTRDGREANG